MTRDRSDGGGAAGQPPSESDGLRDLSRVEPAARPPRIVDLVFAGEPAGQRRRLGLGVAVVLGLYTGILALVSRHKSSLGPGSAEMAARVHDAIAIERTVDLTPPRAPPPPPIPVESAQVARVASLRPARTTHASRGRFAFPAQAGRVAAASPEPIDFTGSAFIAGSGASYAGGATASSGTSRNPGLGGAAPAETAGTAVAGRSRGRPVALDQAAWNCPWPAEADAQQVDEQTVVLRADVGADGRADHVDVIIDPGFGFGAAARLCALATRFDPARDARGQPIAAQSPPIRVHFFR